MLDTRVAARIRGQIKDARELGEKVMLHPDIAAEMLDAWCEKRELAEMFAHVPGINSAAFKEDER